MEPFTVDLSTFDAALASFLQLVGAILSRQRGVIAAVHDDPGMLQLSFVVVLLAGFSERLGQSVVLFANEVTPRRFVMSIILGSILFAGGYVLWVGTIWLLALALGRGTPSLLGIIRAVGLGYAPLLFGFLGLIPYFGSGILNLLYFWVFTAIASAVSIVLGLPAWEGVLLSAAGLLIIGVMRSTVGRPLVKITRRVRNLAAGRRLALKIQQAVAERRMDAFFDDTDLPGDAL